MKSKRCTSSSQLKFLSIFLFSFYWHRNSLQFNKDETLEKLRDSEENNLKLKDGLADTTKQLINNSNELAQSQIELKKSRREINVSFETNKLDFN